MPLSTTHFGFFILVLGIIIIANCLNRSHYVKKIDKMKDTHRVEMADNFSLGYIQGKSDGFKNGMNRARDVWHQKRYS